MRSAAATGLRRRAWRQMERRARRDHDRELQRHLRCLVEAGPVVLDADAAWMSGIVSLRLSGHRLVMGGVAPATAFDLLAVAVQPAVPLRLSGSGRYGKLWWVAVAGNVEQVILATRLHLRHEPGRPRTSELDLPVLSGAC